MLPLKLTQPIRGLALNWGKILPKAAVTVQPSTWKFKRKIKVHFERSHYIVKSVESRQELVQAMRLRYEVFHREFQHKWFPLGFDKDRYDSICDHLVIIDKRINKVVGTYRMIASSFSDEFYSESEFDLKNFLAEPGVKLELSRACIHKDYRNGVIITLLWRGIVDYIKEVGAKYLFGLASVKSLDIQEIAKVKLHLQSQGVLDDKFAIRPIGNFVIPNFSEVEESLVERNVDCSDRSLVPPLFLSYLKAGAKVAPIPALDKDFRCADFLTILEFDKLSDSFERKYKRN